MPAFQQGGQQTLCLRERRIGLFHVGLNEQLLGISIKFSEILAYLTTHFVVQGERQLAYDPHGLANRARAGADVTQFQMAASRGDRIQSTSLEQLNKP